MQGNRAVNRNCPKTAEKWAENFFIVMLALYPLRHIGWGLDLMDTGYNYANFTYIEHMDPMWFFATWLSNIVGNWLTALPKADTLIGMNFYTGLSVSVLALTAYWFCTRRLKLRPWIAFVGEMAAVSLCWCPTALLYNYLTYIILLAGCILLYLGLVKENRLCLVAAGCCLGTNVFVRFSNLPEMGLIVAVWAYDFICALREQRQEREKRSGFWKRTAVHTGLCLAGYLGAAAFFLLVLQTEYGLKEYFSGISRLFAMTDTATDYQATSMLRKLLWEYVETFYWVKRLLVILCGGVILFGLTGMVKGKASRYLKRAAWGIWVVVCAAVPVWLYLRGFCSARFYSYDAMLRSAVLFMMLTMFIALLRIFLAERVEEKLISGMLILILLLTSIGSNNGVYPSINNLFLAAPYTFSQCYAFLKNAKDKKAGVITLSAAPVKGLLTVLLLLCLFQFGGFGLKFVFAEGTGVRDISASVENNAVLRGIGMPEEKAEWMTELSAYVNENGLAGQELITFGTVSVMPSLSFYLQMPAAFNPWCELQSYGYSVMEERLTGLEGTPVIILENQNAYYEEGGVDALLQNGADAQTAERFETDRKFQLLLSFMRERGYEQTFRNGKFAVYRVTE